MLSKQKISLIIVISIILIIVIGFIIKFLAMILIQRYQEINDYYWVLSFVVTIIGFSYLFHEENAKNVILKTIGGTLISLLLFVSIDIAEIKLFAVINLIERISLL